MFARQFPSILAALAILAGCSAPAQAVTHSYSITSFDKLRVEGPFDVHVKVGGASAARATGTQAAIDRLSIEQHGDTLVIRPLPGGWGGWPSADQGKLLIEVAAPSLDEANLAGSGDLVIDRIRGDRLKLSLAGSGDLSVTAIDVTQLGVITSGSGDVTLAGRARQANTIVTGSGDLHGDKLVTDDATVTLVGSGNLALGAGHTAKVSLAGSGDITIVGKANCAITRTGSGDVHCDHQVSGQ